MMRCKLISLGLAVIFVSGCGVGLKENLRGAVGISTKVLEDNLPRAGSKEFNLGYDSAYSKTQKIIKEIKGYIYAVDKSKNLIAIYVSQEDTTPVGIFFQEIDKTKTRVSISSPSDFAQKLIAEKIFAGLEK